MNWITNFVKPKLQALVTTKKRETADDLWHQCPSCEQMIYHRELSRNLFVCHHCEHHMRLKAKQRLELLFDNEKFDLIKIPPVQLDPLKFKDTKKYPDRLKAARATTGEDDAIQIAEGKLDGRHVVIASFDFQFMGGSMGMAVGEGLVIGANLALKRGCPYLVIPASGGARMQEGILSLMQMPRSTVAVSRVKEAGLPYITLLTDPTTGGVSASFAMLGDISIAEPNALIGFAGARVIKETIRAELPKGFQRSEYLLDHGMVDMVIHRKDLKAELSKLFSLLLDHKVSSNPYNARKKIQ